LAQQGHNTAVLSKMHGGITSPFLTASSSCCTQCVSDERPRLVSLTNSWPMVTLCSPKSDCLLTTLTPPPFHPVWRGSCGNHTHSPTLPPRVARLLRQPHSLPHPSTPCGAALAATTLTPPPFHPVWRGSCGNHTHSPPSHPVWRGSCGNHTHSPPSHPVWRSSCANHTHSPILPPRVARLLRQPHSLPHPSTPCGAALAATTLTPPPSHLVWRGCCGNHTHSPTLPPRVARLLRQPHSLPHPSTPCGAALAATTLTPPPSHPVWRGCCGNHTHSPPPFPPFQPLWCVCHTLLRG